MSTTLEPTLEARTRRTTRRTYRRRRIVTALGAIVLALGILLGAIYLSSPSGPTLSPLDARIVSIADSQLGYRTDPPNSYCNRYSAYFGSGATSCPAGLRSEEWCADFAAWVWRSAGVQFSYGNAPGELNGAAISFYRFGLAHHTWHQKGENYVPRAGDVAIYGLDLAAGSAAHVAVVTGDRPGARGPNVVNGDGSRTAFSIVEAGTDQWKADIHIDGALLAGYVSPPSTRKEPSRR